MVNSTCLISVIVPIYKVEEYLHACVDSILEQTYVNLEVILVDDGSPDLCGQICDEYSRKDLRIKVIHKKNGGLSDARNAGLDIAQGEYIYFVDSDDIIHPELLEKLFILIKKYGADISICRYQIFNDGDSPKIILGQHGNVECFSDFEMLDNLYNPKYAPANIVAWNKLYRRSIWNSLRYKVGIINEDEDLAVKLYLSKDVTKICWLNEDLIFYRKRIGSIMDSTKTRDKMLHIYNIYDERVKLIEGYGDRSLIRKYEHNRSKQALFYYIKIDDKFFESIVKKNFFQLLSSSKLSGRAKILMLFLLIKRSLICF